MSATPRSLVPVPSTCRGGSWHTPRAFVVTPNTSPPVSVRTVGATGAVINVALCCTEGEDGTAGPRVIAVYSEALSDDELDLAGAVNLREQVAALLPRLDAMIAALAADARHHP